jgi:plastocyanin
MKKAKLLIFLLTVGFLFLMRQPAQAASWTVQENGLFAFSPASLSITQGDTVTWTNTTALTGHTSISGSPPGTPDGIWNSGTNGPHTIFTFTFNVAPGPYPYYCVQHLAQSMTGIVTVASATIPPPSVSITNPATGAKFVAPAGIVIKADATQTSGSITNMRFFSGTTSLGNVTSSPYNFPVNNAAAGNYSFKAVAMNNQGGAATSAVVNVFVLTNAILSAPTRLTNGQFQFTVHGIAGQTYATEASTNLINWTALATNIAPANSFNVTDSTSANILRRFYRARQDL